MEEQVIEEWYGHNTEPGHDKVYLSRVVDRGNGTYIHQTGYGKRGSNLRLETSGVLNEKTARTEHAKTVEEKRRNKYKDTTASAIGLVAQKKDSSVVVEEPKAKILDRHGLWDYIADPTMIMQELSHRPRLSLSISKFYNYTIGANGRLSGISTTDIPEPLRDYHKELFTKKTTGQYQIHGYLSDGESGTQKFVIEDRGDSVVDKPLDERLSSIDELLLPKNHRVIVASCASTYQEKVMLLRALKMRKAEGVVFRKRDSKYKYAVDNEEPLYLLS